MRRSGTVLAAPASDQGFTGELRSTPLPVWNWLLRGW